MMVWCFFMCFSGAAAPQLHHPTYLNVAASGITLDRDISAQLAMSKSLTQKEVCASLLLCCVSVVCVSSEGKQPLVSECCQNNSTPLPFATPA